MSTSAAGAGGARMAAATAWRRPDGRRAPRLPLLVLAALTVPTWARPAAAQPEEPAYQLVSFGVGWGAVRPVGRTGLATPVVDGNASLHLSAAFDMRQNDWALVYARFEADVAEARQHVSLNAGARLMPPLDRAVLPYIGAGGGLLILAPRSSLAALITREYALRAEAFLGIEWPLAPGVLTFVEYRASGARYVALAQVAGCEPLIECLDASFREKLHVGHAGWVGLRIRVL